MKNSVSRDEFFNYDNEESRRTFLNLHNLLKNKMTNAQKGEKILESALTEVNILRKDTLDRFIDFLYFKAKTGYPHMINMAFPSKRISDRDIESTAMDILNHHLYPEVTLRLLKFFTRNVQNSDTNIYLAYLIEDDALIKSIYDTFQLFRSDIAKKTPDERSNNVKRIQQFSIHADNSKSSPMDAACRLKYVLEFIALKQNVNHIYTKNDLLLWRPPQP